MKKNKVNQAGEAFDKAAATAWEAYKKAAALAREAYAKAIR